MVKVKWSKEAIEDIHPGEILSEEYLKPMGVSAYRLAKETKIPQTRISEIILDRRRVSADSALRFSKFFGTTPTFWLGLQNDFDLKEERNSKQTEFDSIIQFEFIKA